MDTTDAARWTLSYEAEGSDDAAWTLRHGAGWDTTVYEVTDQIDADDSDAAKTWAAKVMADKHSEIVGDWQAYRPGPGTAPEFWTATIAEPSAIATATAIFSVVRGESPTARAVEPGPVIDIPAEVLAWAEGHGYGPEDTDVYLLVTPEDEAGEVDGEIAWAKFQIPATDVAAIREALDPEDA